MHRVSFDLFEGQAAAGQLDAFLSAYEEVYAEPPYCEGPREVKEFIDRYQAQVQRPGMRLVLARDGQEVAGFCFGYFLPSETGWWKNIREPLSDDFTYEDGTRTYAIIELAVRKPWRRLRVGRGLHDRLLDGLDVERVTLTVRPEPEAAAAQSAYSAWGYRTVGVSHPWEGAPYYDALVLELGG